VYARTLSLVVCGHSSTIFNGQWLNGSGLLQGSIGYQSGTTRRCVIDGGSGQSAVADGNGRHEGRELSDRNDNDAEGLQ